MIEHTPEITELVKGLAQVQSKVHGVGKDSVNPHFKNRYASLEAVIGAVREPMIESGMVFTQAPGVIVEGALEITTMLIHKSGQWMRSTLHVPLAKTDPQGVGSATTYGCRYALMAMLGLPPLDDDGESAVNHGAPVRSISSPKQTAAPTQNAAGYVAQAKPIIAAFKNEKALKNWWANEKENRDKFKLDPNSGPGAELMMAYGDKKAAFQSELMDAG